MPYFNLKTKIQKALQEVVRESVVFKRTKYYIGSSHLHGYGHRIPHFLQVYGILEKCSVGAVYQKFGLKKSQHAYRINAQKVQELEDLLDDEAIEIVTYERFEVRRNREVVYSVEN